MSLPETWGTTKLPKFCVFCQYLRRIKRATILFLLSLYFQPPPNRKLATALIRRDVAQSVKHDNDLLLSQNTATFGRLEHETMGPSLNHCSDGNRIWLGSRECSRILGPISSGSGRGQWLDRDPVEVCSVLSPPTADRWRPAVTTDFIPQK